MKGLRGVIRATVSSIWPWRAPLIALVAGLALTAWWVVQVQRQQWAMVLAAFRFHAEERGHFLRELMERNREDVASIVRFYECSEFVEAEEFRLFVTPILDRSDIVFVTWRPFRDDSLFEFSPAGEGDYCEPSMWIEQVQAVNLWDEPALVETLSRVGRKPGLFLSPPVTSLLEKGEAAVFLCAPVRSAAKPAEGDKRRVQRGILVACIGWSRFLSSALQPFRQTGLWVQVKDVSDPNDPRVVAEEGDFRQVREDARWSRIFPWADRMYRVEIGMTPSFLSARMERAALWFYALGPLASSFLAIYLAAVLAARRRAEELATIRTKELRQREESLRRSMEESRLLFSALEQAGEGIAFLDEEGRITLINPAFERLTGHSKAEAIGRDYLELLSGRDPEGEAIRETIRETLKKARFWNGLFSTRRKDGTLFQAGVSFTPIKGPHGGDVRWVVVFSDMTAIVDEKERRHQVQRLESIGSLAGGIAHDLNNLLQPILGYAEMIQTDSGLPRAVRNDVESIREAAQKARDLVLQLMAFARKQRLQLAILDLNEVIVAIGGFLRRTLRENIRIEYRLHKPLPHIRADKVQLEQVFLNLAVNAQEAMPEGGCLTIETADVKAEPGSSTLGREIPMGRYVRLTVRDTGVGMDEETQQRVFEPFFTTKGREHRTGMGLAMVYGIVRQHGGHIVIRSKLGEGAEFQIFMPVVEVSEEKEEPGNVLSSADSIPAAGGSLGKGRTVLLAEDEESVRKLVRAMLIRLGFQVVTASSIEEILALARHPHQPVDLLLTDIVMPGLSGLELYRRLSAERPGLPVIFMSGYADAAKLGRQGWPAHVPYLQKPFDLPSLEAALKRAFSMAQASSFSG